MGSRRKARVLAFQGLFSWEFTGDASVIQFSWLEEERKKAYDTETLSFAALMLAGALENIEKIDEVIKSKLEHWDFKRINKVDLAVLRLGAFSLLYQQDIPARVTIDEAVDIAKQFGSDESFRFINGVLDGIHRQYGNV